MASYFRGDTFPVVVKYSNYTFQEGDVVTVAIFDKEWNTLAEQELVITGECEEVQVELSREQMHDVLGECVVEARTVTTSNLEMTIQREVDFKEDGLR